MPVAARAAWEVVAGMIPLEPISEYCRRFEINSVEWENEQQRDQLFSDRAGAAHAWAQHLEFLAASGRAVNWVRVDFYWY